MNAPILTTSNHVDGHTVADYKGIVSVQVIQGINVWKDIVSGFRSMLGGRMKAMENEIAEGFAIAQSDIAAEAEKRGADAVIGIEFDASIQSVGTSDKIAVVTATGTAVTLIVAR